MKIALSKKSSPVETVPARISFSRLKNITKLVKFLGVYFCNETCTFAEVTDNPSKPTFQMTMKDSLGQPVSNCSSFLDVKIFAEYGSYHKYCALQNQCDVERLEIIDKGNGCYEFSTTCDDMQPFKIYAEYYGYPRHKAAQKKHGMVAVQVFGKDVPKSPLM